MALSIDSLKKTKMTKPPRILIYGTEGIGKTTLASEFPSPAFIQTEDGTPKNLEIQSFGHLTSFAEVMEAVAALYTEEHDRKTVVFDSLSALQRLVWKEVCARGDDKGEVKGRIDDFGYGKGYGYALNVWQEFLEGVEALRLERDMTVIFIAHAAIREFKDPETEPYDQYAVDLHTSKTKTSTLELFKRESDEIWILKKEIEIKKDNPKDAKSRGRGGGGIMTWICTQPRPAYIAKTRLGLPEKILFQPGKGYEKLAPYLAGKAPAEQEAPEPETKAAPPPKAKKNGNGARAAA